MAFSSSDKGRAAGRVALSGGAAVGMRRVLVGLLFLGVAAQSSCSYRPVHSGPGEARSEDHAPRYSSQREADADLERFGRANPQCPLWTNWQKLCSRTGPGGSIHCNVDPGRRVEPSEPFCARGMLSHPRTQSLEQRRSGNRFCRERAPLHGISSAGPVPDIEVCTRYDPTRPFNGRRIAALLHPSCDRWSDSVSHRPVCTMGGSYRGGIPDCVELARRGYEHPQTLVCSAPEANLCPRTSGRSGPEDEERIFIDDGIPVPDGRTVHGVQCERARR
jgi:hypothetical protein